MFNWIRRRIIGGESGKREVTLFLVFLVAFAAGFAIFQEARGVDMEKTFSFLMVVAPTAIAALFAAHGLEHWKPGDTTSTHSMRPSHEQSAFRGYDDY